METLNVTQQQVRQRELFAIEYSLTLNAADAARKAGYAEASARVQGCRLLKRPDVRKRVDELLADRARDSRLQADSVLDRLDRLANWCMVPVAATDSRGRPQGDRPLNAAIAARCLETLGRHLGLWVERVETTTDQTIELVFPKAVAPGEDEDSFENVDAVWRAEIEAVPHPRIGDGGTATDDDAPADETDGEQPEVIEQRRNMAGIVLA